MRLRTIPLVALVALTVLTALPATAAPPASPLLDVIPTPDGVTLTWEATGADDTYRVIRDGVEVATLQTLTYLDDVATGTAHDYVIEAVGPDGIVTPLGSVTGTGIDLEVDDPVGYLWVSPLDIGGIRIQVATRMRVTEAVRVGIRINGVAVAEQDLNAVGTATLDLPETIVDTGDYIDAVLYDAVDNVVVMLQPHQVPTVEVIVDSRPLPAPPVNLTGRYCNGRTVLAWDTYDGNGNGTSGVDGTADVTGPTGYDILIDGDLVDTVTDPRWSGLVGRGSTVAVRSVDHDPARSGRRQVTHPLPVTVPDTLALTCQTLQVDPTTTSTPDLMLIANPTRVAAEVGSYTASFARPDTGIIGVQRTTEDGAVTFTPRSATPIMVTTRPGDVITFIDANGQPTGTAAPPAARPATLPLTALPTPTAPAVDRIDATTVTVDLTDSRPDAADQLEVRLNGQVVTTVPAATDQVTVTAPNGSMAAIQVLAVAADGSRSAVSPVATPA